MEDPLKREALELTEMLRTDPQFSRFRSWLTGRGLDVNKVWLAGLIDNADGVVLDGDGGSVGVVVVPSGRVFEFEGYVYDSPGEVFRWEEVSPMDACTDWPAVAAAIESL